MRPKKLIWSNWTLDWSIASMLEAILFAAGMASLCKTFIISSEFDERLRVVYPDNPEKLLAWFPPIFLGKAVHSQYLKKSFNAISSRSECSQFAAQIIGNNRGRSRVHQPCNWRSAKVEFDTLGLMLKVPRLSIPPTFCLNHGIGGDETSRI